MGQAKMRGTFEQRQEEGIAKRKAREADRKKMIIKAARSNKSNLLVLAMMAGLGINPNRWRP